MCFSPGLARKSEDEPRAHIEPAAHGDCPAHRAHDSPHQPQADTEAALRCAVADAFKSIEDPIAVRLRDAQPAIAHGDQRVRLRLPNGDPDWRALTVFD